MGACITPDDQVTNCGEDLILGGDILAVSTVYPVVTCQAAGQANLGDYSYLAPHPQKGIPTAPHLAPVSHPTIGLAWSGLLSIYFSDYSNRYCSQSMLPFRTSSFIPAEAQQGLPLLWRRSSSKLLKPALVLESHIMSSYLMRPPLRYAPS